jgi:hypothetical protein
MTRSRLEVVELVIILAMSLAASYAMLGTSAAFLVPFVALFILGVLTVIWIPQVAFVFQATTVLMNLPALMKLNGVKWWVFSPERLDFSPTLSLPMALVIGLLVVSGGLLLNYLRPLRRELRELDRSQADPKQTRQYAANQSLAAGATVSASAVLGAVIVLVVGVVRDNLATSVRDLSWAMPVVGIVSIVALALTIFWLAGTSKKAQDHSK